MTSKNKVVSTVLTAALLSGILCVPAVAAESTDTRQKIEVHSAQAKNPQSNLFDLKTRVDRLFEPSFRSSIPWFAEPFAWRMMSDMDWWDNKMDQLTSHSINLGGYFPRLETSEDEKQVKISAEVPGIDESQLDVTVNGDMVTIKGQKEDSIQPQGKSKRATERRYGSFERTVKLPYQVDSEKAEATLKNGVLTVVAPKLPNQSADGRKISIRRE